MASGNKVFLENFETIAWFGRCIFVSWYCEVGTCKFCFRSTTKHQIQHARKAKRSLSSLLADALIGRECGWRIEFLTGGYGAYTFDELLDIAAKVSHVFGYKIWVNIGTLTEPELLQLKPYVEGVCASIETIDKGLHDYLCPDKNIEPYSDFLDLASKHGFRKSITIVIGVGEEKEHISQLFEYIEKHKLDRITFYALKPVRGTGYTKSPDPEYYAWWIEQTRLKFPKLEIVAGLTPQTPEYTELILKAGANAITKFPVVRKFNSSETRLIEQHVKNAGRDFVSTLTKLPQIDWDAKVDELDFSEELKQQIREKLKPIINKMQAKD
mgnify:CR=1 FL=1